MPVAATDFSFPGQSGYYRGKVRDVYYFDKTLVAIATDRISAFDHILPRPIPYKGQVLNQLAAYFLDATKDIVPNWKQSVPHPNVTMGLVCEPIRIEMVIRGYLAGHALREYKAGKRVLCGEPMPEGMIDNQAFPQPIITPATKADSGHDEDISAAEIIRREIVPKEVFEEMSRITRALFQRGTEMAAKRGLILVDTKYEFGWHNGTLMIIDEVHTPDSSRYWYADKYDQNQQDRKPQEQLSKEFVREWLMANGFQGLEGQKMPDLDDAFVDQVSNRYIALYEQMTGEDFEKGDDAPEVIEAAILNALPG